MGGVEILENFTEYTLTYDVPARGLIPGDTVVKESTGIRYGYGIVGGAFAKGQIVRSARHANLTNGTTNTLTRAQAVGSKRLQDTGAFTGKENVIVGARGVIATGGGIGQNFIVTRWISNDEIEIKVISDFTGLITTGNWKTALTTSSTYNLSHPGIFFAQDSATLNDDEGFAQVAAVAADVGKARIYVPRTGRLMATFDASGNAIAQGERVVKTAGGLIQGIPAVPTNAATLILSLAALDATVGYAIHGDIGGSVDGLIWINGAIPDPSRNISTPFRLDPYIKHEIYS
jgi:hypothetical protein